VADGKRNREMGLLAIALCVLFALVMVYAWQHFSAVEYGYKIEALRTQSNNLSEANRALQLEAASLSDPERIDALARQMGLSSPQPGQVMRLEPSSTDGAVEPVMARVSDRVAEIAVVAATP
jgi:cell division protein FtsL